MSTDWYAPNQQAVRADGSGPAEEGDGGSTAGNGNGGDGPSLANMTKAELLVVAADRGIEADESMTNAQIREAIEAG